MTDVKKIPLQKIDEGIRISLRKSLQHLDGAELLVHQNLLDDAIALIEFAIEEFGRAIYLKERLDNRKDFVEKSLEKNHWLKYNKAFSILPEELKTIWESTISPQVPKEYFPKGYFPIIKETISPRTRLNAIFPYFDENSQSWYDGVNVDGNKLLKIIISLKENIQSAFYH